MTSIEAQNILEQTDRVVARIQSKIRSGRLSERLRGFLLGKLSEIKAQRQSISQGDGLGFPFLIPLIAVGTVITSAFSFGISKNVKDALSLEKRVDCILRGIEELGLTEQQAEEVCRPSSSNISTLLILSVLGVGAWLLFKK